MNQNRLSYVLSAAALVAALVAAGLYWWLHRAPHLEPSAEVPAVPTAPPAQPVAQAPAAPAIKHPIEAVPASAPLAAGAADGDAFVRRALDELLGAKAVATFLQTDGFPRRMAATVDNLGRPQAAARLWPVNPMPGRFSVAGKGDATVIDPDNGRRYTPFVQFVESFDPGRAAALYKQLYPQLQQSYEELGYPGRYFNDRLVEVIDQLLATPEPEGPLAVHLTEVKGPMAPPTRPWVRYEFSDPQLESLSAGQKMMLRSGVANERRLKAKLREFRKLVATGAANR